MTKELNFRVLRQQNSGEETILSFSGTGVLEINDAKVLGTPLSPQEFALLSGACLRFGCVTADSTWWISTHNTAWTCAINDRLLARDDKTLVNVDDTLEVGLLRMRIVAGMDTGISSSSSLLVTPAAQDNQQLQEIFDLGSLADRQSRLEYGDEEDPFAIIGGKSPYEAEPATELPPPLPEEIPDKISPVSASDTSPVPSEATVSPLVNTSLANSDVFALLAQEYAKVIHDPDYLHQQYWGEEAPPVHVDLTIPGPAELAQGWDARQSLEDFVSGHLSIQHILEHYNITDTQKLEITAHTDEVLTLFAQNVRSSGYIPTSIPELNRREHHQLGFDSPLETQETVSFNSSQAERP
jgi:hypothetical protein